MLLGQDPVAAILLGSALALSASPSASSIVCSAIRPAARPGPASGGPVLDTGLLPLGHHQLLRRFWKKRGF